MAVEDTADEDSQEQKEDDTRDSPIKAEETVDTGSQHVLKVCCKSTIPTEQL